MACPVLSSVEIKAFNNLGGGAPAFALGDLLACLTSSGGISFVALSESLPASTTTGDVLTAKITATITLPEASTYLVLVSYGWNKNTSTADFEAVLAIDGDVVNPSSGIENMLHRQEPKDFAGISYPTGSASGTDQAHLACSPVTVSLGAGAHTLELFYRNTVAGNACTIWNARLLTLRLV